MAKISHHFKLAEDAAEQLRKIAHFYTVAQSKDEFLPPKTMTNTDIVEWLIRKEYQSLQEQGYEI